MDIIAHLEADHAKLKSIFEQLCSTTTRAIKTRNELVATIQRELEVHMEFEETLFYPAVTGASDDKGQELTREAYAEHAAASDVLARLLALSPEDEMWKATMTVLKEQLEHHIEEEEQQMFPMARRLLDRGTLRTMGDQYAAMKARSKETVADHHQQLVGLH